MLRKILIALVIAIPVAYGGAKLYVAHTISSDADKIIAQIAPLADIKYQGTTSSLFGGMVGLTGVTVQPRRGDSFYRVGAVKIKSDNIFPLLGMNIERGKVPKMFDVELDKLTMPLSGQMLEKAHGDLGLLGDLHTPLGVLGCGKRTSFSEADLADMGIDQITTNLNMEVLREPLQNDIRVMVRVDDPGINRADVDLRFVAPEGMLVPQRLMRTVPLLKSLTVKFQDQGWHNRVATFCTHATHMTRTAYLDAHMAAVRAALANMGFRVSNDLVIAYRGFLKNGGNVKLSITPQSPIDLTNLGLYSVQEAIDYLAPTLWVNGRMVKQLNVAETKPRHARGTLTGITAVPAAATAGRYLEIPYNSLRRYIGRQVRLTTDTDHVFAGKLLSISGRVATLNVSIFGRTQQEIVLLTHVAKTELMVPARKAVH